MLVTEHVDRARGHGAGVIALGIPGLISREVVSAVFGAGITGAVSVIAPRSSTRGSAEESSED